MNWKNGLNILCIYLGSKTGGEQAPAISGLFTQCNQLNDRKKWPTCQHGHQGKAYIISAIFQVRL